MNGRKSKEDYKQVNMDCPDCNGEMVKSYLIENGEGVCCVWICNCKVPIHIIHRARQEGDKFLDLMVDGRENS